MRSLSIFAVLLSCFSMAWADEKGEASAKKSSLPFGFDIITLGYYAGASVGPSNWEPSLNYTPGVTVDEKDLAKRIFFGIPVNDTYAIELSYTQTSASVTASNGELVQAGGALINITADGTADLDLNSLAVGGRGIWPLVEGLSGTASLGVHRWSADMQFSSLGGPDVSDSGLNLYLGLGLEYYWNRNFSFRGGVERVMADEEADLFLVGASLSF